MRCFFDVFEDPNAAGGMDKRKYAVLYLLFSGSRGCDRSGNASVEYACRSEALWKSAFYSSSDPDPVLITGGIHLDGLLDTADALSSYKTKEEKLEILKDSHAGAFAIIIGICWFVLDFGIYSEAGAHTIGLLAIGFVISRALSGLSLVSFRMAKNTGLAATFSDMALKSRVRIVMICYLIVCAGLLLYLDPLYGTAELIGALLVFFWYRHLSYEKFGGITGDLAGFFLQNCELFMAVCVIGLRIVLR